MHLSGAHQCRGHYLLCISSEDKFGHSPYLRPSLIARLYRTCLLNYHRGEFTNKSVGVRAARH